MLRLVVGRVARPAAGVVPLYDSRFTGDLMSRLDAWSEVLSAFSQRAASTFVTDSHQLKTTYDAVVIGAGLFLTRFQTNNRTLTLAHFKVR